MNRINIAYFDQNKTPHVYGIWQWDYGQILRIQGLTLPSAVEIDFSLNDTGGESTPRIGVTKDGVTDVVIPDSMLEKDTTQDYCAYAFIYLTDDVSGQTEYKIILHVKARPKPEGRTSDDTTTMAAILKAVNEIAERTGASDEKIAEAVDNYMAANPIEETDPTVSEWAKQPEKPTYTASEVGADAAGTAESKLSEHNVSDTSHNDIRLLVDGLTTRLNALADSDDETLDQMSEVVAYIKSNKSLIDAITTSKINVSDIVDNLTTNVANKPLSAAQGVAIKALIDAISIPDKLPNPNALTFTGAVDGSYDGSEPKTINIPNGGGAENWELIADITTDGDTGIFEFTGLNYREIIVDFWFDGTFSTNSAYTMFSVNGVNCRVARMIRTNNSPAFRFHVELFDGVIFERQIFGSMSATTSYESGWTLCEGTEEINTFVFGKGKGTSYNYDAGSRIVVRGRK